MQELIHSLMAYLKIKQQQPRQLKGWLGELLHVGKADILTKY